MKTKVAIVTQDDPFYMPLFFEEFLPRLGNQISISRVSILDILDESFFDFLKRMYGFYGPTNFCRRGLNFLYRRGLDSIGVGKYSVESVVESYDISTETRNDINDEQYINWIETEEIDIVLSVSAPQIFDTKLLDAPNWGCINVHTADLPKYRGLLPTFWALYHGEDQIGVTVHTMEEELDRGKIVKQSSIPIDDSTTLDDAIKQGKKEGGRTAADALIDISTGTVTLREMEGKESYFSFPTAEDRREFQRRGRTLL